MPGAVRPVVAVKNADDRRAARRVAFLLGAITLLVFSPGLGGAVLNWDDDINLLINPHIAAITPESLRWMFTNTEHALRYKPLCWLVWAGLHQFFTVGHAPYGIVNAVLHAANAVLLFFVLRRMLPGLLRRREFAPSSVLIASAIAAALWAWHPQRIEPVAWISGLGYPLAAAFGLAAMLRWIGYRESGESVLRSRAAWEAMALFALALLSYPTAVSMLGVFALAGVAGASWVRGERVRSARRLMVDLSPFALSAAALLAFTGVQRLGHPGAWDATPLQQDMGTGDRLTRALGEFGWAAERIVWPSPISPVFDAFCLSPNPGLPWELIVVAALTMAAVGAWRWSAVPLLCWGAFLLAFAPHAGWTDGVHSPADRYAYVPAIAVAILSGWFLLNTVVAHGRGRLVGALGALAAGIVSFAHAGLWRDNIKLFSHTLPLVKTSSYRADIALRLGRALTAANRPAEAVVCLCESERVVPHDSRLPSALGDALAAAKRADEAAFSYERALDLDPQDAGAANRLALLCLQRGDVPGGLRVLEPFVGYEGDPTIRLNLALLYWRDHQIERAASLLSDPVLRDSPYAEALLLEIAKARAPAAVADPPGVATPTNAEPRP